MSNLVAEQAPFGIDLSSTSGAVEFFALLIFAAFVFWLALND